MPTLEANAQSALKRYLEISEHSMEIVNSLEKTSIANAYFKFLETRIVLLSPHLQDFAQLYAYAMLPDSSISPADFSTGLRDPLMQAFQDLIKQSEDAPTKEDDNHNLAMLLYTFHFLLMLFWLYDRTEEKRATGLFIKFLRDFVKLTRPMMLMPLVNNALAKMAKIMMLVFGGARLTED